MATKTAPVTEMLIPILAETYALAVKTHGAHWNVTGSGFFELHERFGEQYEALFEAADDLAERVRALGAKAPVGLGELAKLAQGAADSSDSRVSSEGRALVALLLKDHRTLSRRLSVGVKVAQSAGDEATADLLIGRIHEHDKTAWMLQATLA